MHSATCSIKFTTSDWYSPLHNDCFRSIDWLSGVISLPHLAVVFLSSNCLFSYCVDNVFPKYLHVKKSGQNSQKTQGIQAFDWKKSPRNAVRTLLSLAGLWISTVHMTFQYSFWLSSGFFCLKTGWNDHFGQLIDKLRENKNSEPFWTVSNRVGCTVLVGLKIHPWRRDGALFLTKINLKTVRSYTNYCDNFWY